MLFFLVFILHVNLEIKIRSVIKVCFNFSSSSFEVIQFNCVKYFSQP